jgi:hypothetical protein
MKMNLFCRWVWLLGIVVTTCGLVAQTSLEPNPVDPSVSPATNEVVVPVVKVVATDPEAAETATDRPANPGMFTLIRSGPTNHALFVSYSLSGTASNGVDYERIALVTTIPAGAKEARIGVVPIDDKLPESTEQVVLKLEVSAWIMIYPPPPGYYEVGPTNRAVVEILDNDSATNARATLTITAPTNGAIFAAPAKVEIQATAIDPKGYISHIDFYANTNKIGESTIMFIRAPDPGTPIFHSFRWTNVAAGNYVLTTQAKSSDDKSVSSPPVNISVRTPEPLWSAQRELPIFYVPGVSLTVRLRVQAGTNVHAYAVEDRPPQGWQVGPISHEGIYDRVNNKIKFGPFFDREPRTLTYVLTPPMGSTGTKEFLGTISVDGVGKSITGNHLLPVAPRHPADRNPSDMRIVLNEVTAYAASWRTGTRWLDEPNPIPISYVTRASYLWKAGEGYRLEPSITNAPQWWVPVATNANTSPQKFSLVTDSSQGESFAPATAVAVRNLPVRFTAGVPLQVSIQVAPPANALCYAAVEQIPNGYQVTQVNGDGAIDAQAGQIKWGPFLDNQVRTLTYELVPASTPITESTVLRGLVSVDGQDAPIGGLNRVSMTDGPLPVPQLLSLKTSSDGACQITFTGLPSQSYGIDVSEDLVHWTSLGLFVADMSGLIELSEWAPVGVKNRFYRARIEP